MKKLYPSFANPETWRNNTKKIPKRNFWRAQEHATAVLDIKEKISVEQWRVLRLKILRRDNYTCKYCGFRAEKWQIVHHIDGNPNNNNSKNLETICPMCNLIHHAGQGCVVQEIVDLYKESNYSQNTIIRITRNMRSKGKTDMEIIKSLGLKNKVPFKMDKGYLRRLLGFVTSRRTTQNWTQRALEYGYKHMNNFPENSLLKFI